MIDGWAVAFTLRFGVTGRMSWAGKRDGCNMMAAFRPVPGRVCGTTGFEGLTHEPRTDRDRRY
jgi:hypothetical protein